MSGPGTEVVHRGERRLIDRHFAGRATPASEAKLRAHLEDCATCRAYYDRHVVLAGLDPAAPTARTRLAAGLGFAPERRRRWLTFLSFPMLAVGAAAAAGLLLFHRGQPGADAFSPRGGGGTAAAAPAQHIVRVLGAEAFAPIGDTIAADEALAFAHVNAGGLARLMIVAVDEHGHRYWFHPDVERGRASITIGEDGGTRTELGEAIRHHFDGRVLRVLGLFSQDALTVETVDGLVDPSGCAGLGARLPEVTCVETKVEVRDSRDGSRERP
jgi:hypothetical protein